MSSPVHAFEAQRPRLIGLAYRMLGDAAEAQDVVQDAWLRWSGADPESVANPSAFLTRVVTRLCLDRLKSARSRREEYVGPWLPEPIPTDASSPMVSRDPEEHAALAGDLSYALLVALERLTATERAALLLHDVFDQDYADLARTLDRSESACRQLVSRARRHVRSPRSRNVDPGLHRDLLERFIGACATGDASALSALLREDAVQISDGGGVVAAARKPIVGARAIIKFQVGLLDLHRRNGWQVDTAIVQLNGEAAVLVWVEGDLAQAVFIEVDGDRISRIYAVRNPSKLDALVALYRSPPTSVSPAC